MNRETITDIFAIQELPLQAYSIGTITFNMIDLPGSDQFLMGNNSGEEDSDYDEQPRHSRKIAAFAIAQYPVTQALWDTVVKLGERGGVDFDSKLLPPKPSYISGTNRAVENISWEDSKEFCRVLNILCEKPEGFFRLPFEPEWEYAARSGERKTLYAGSNHLTEVGWYDQNNNKETMPIGLLSPNKFGLYELSGNVWEWCENEWHEDYLSNPNSLIARGDGSTKEGRTSFRATRGGCWYDYAWDCRCACRYENGASTERDPYFGFRLASPIQL